MSRFICILLVFAFSSVAGAVSITFTSSQNFIVPVGVTSINVLAIGGGGGGANGHQGGGGAGFLNTGTFTVSSGQSIFVTVGSGGDGAITQSNNNIVGLTAGTSSSFGGFLTVNGGGVVSGVNQGGHNGSSGGGAACNGGSLAGFGGSGGSNGQPCQSGTSMPIGLGQGDYTPLLALFVDNAITAGLGGAGGTGSHAGGGGAGGILINNAGINASNGLASFSGLGGKGFGSGGGAGGFNGGNRIGGGDGADGLVYIEFNTSGAVPEPSTFVLAFLGLFVLGFSKKTRSV